MKCYVGILDKTIQTFTCTFMDNLFGENLLLGKFRFLFLVLVDVIDFASFYLQTFDKNGPQI